MSTATLTRPGTAADAIRKGRQYMGYVEGPPPGHDGNETIFGRWYGLDRNPWCCMFISYLLFTIGVQFGPKGTKGFAYCPSALDWCRKQGLVISRPRVGALVFYGFGNRIPVHVGLVVKVYADGSFDALEGNTSDGNDTNGGVVMVRHRTAAQVIAYAMPRYGADTTAKQAAAANRAKPAKVIQHRTLALTSPLTRGADVAAVQRRLIALKFLPAKNAQRLSNADGVYGNDTTQAVIAFQKSRGLRRDGVTGPRTWHELGI